MEFKQDISIVLSGAAGQGIQTIEFILTRLMKLSGFNVYATKEYMSRVRGGSNSTLIRVSSKPVTAFSEKIDILIPLQKNALQRLKKRITRETLILCDSDFCSGDAEVNILNVPIMETAVSSGNKIYSNTVAIGVVCGLFGLEPESLKSYLIKFFSGKPEKVIQENLTAAEKGIKLGSGLIEKNHIVIGIERDKTVADDILINGAEAIGFGSVAGGCNFISSYPMSPSTGVLVFLSQNAERFGIIAEQAEDEISAINMSLGASYAGARAMVTTSGGGFALMEEGVSLAGMIETPIVIHLAQRPGPATGLPTRTEQGDLNLVMFSGHGD
ncbi:MAG: 2-oxoacid:acceptor oxidoreductase family protein, partial [bacterium]|nr:2-oxoacid:acceptor oxidoreductase family protein [bacterium]